MVASDNVLMRLRPEMTGSNVFFCYLHNMEKSQKQERNRKIFIPTALGSFLPGSVLENKKLKMGLIVKCKGENLAA